MSASALTAKLKDRVISKGYKVQNANHLLATSNMRGVVPCLINYKQIVYTPQVCKQYRTNTCSIFNYDIIEPPPISDPIPLPPVQKSIPVVTYPTVLRLPIDSGYVYINHSTLAIDGGSPFSASRFLIMIDGGGP